MEKVWDVEFTGTRSNIAGIRNRVGRMQNMDGDVNVSLLMKPRNKPYQVWIEREMRWAPLKEGDVIVCLGYMSVPKYGVLPSLAVLES